VGLKFKLVQTVQSVQNWHLPHLSVIIIPEPLVRWGHICALWKGLQILYHVHIVHFFWFCISLSQQGFVRILSVKNRIWVNVDVVVVYFGVLVCCLCSMDEMLIRFSLVFDRWMTTPMPPLEPTDGSVVTDCIAPGFPPCSGMCCTASATRVFLRTVAACTVSLGWGTARSKWTFWLTPLTRPWWLGLPRLGGGRPWW
jgi:hypothetical protein